MLIHSTGNPGLDAWILSLPVSPASPSALPENEKERMTNETDGPPRSESFAKYDRDTCSWRTFQVSLLTLTLELYSGPWPKVGMMHAGACYRQQPLAHRTFGNGYGLLPTPTVNDQRQRFNQSLSPGATKRPNLAAMARSNLWPTPTASDLKHNDIYGRSLSLGGAVKLWPTPKASDTRGKWTNPTPNSCPRPEQVGGTLNSDW